MCFDLADEASATSIVGGALEVLAEFHISHLFS
jgi:hypothetical protein